MQEVGWQCPGAGRHRYRDEELKRFTSWVVGCLHSDRHASRRLTGFVCVVNRRAGACMHPLAAAFACVPFTNVQDEHCLDQCPQTPSSGCCCPPQVEGPVARLLNKLASQHCLHQHPSTSLLWLLLPPLLFVPARWRALWLACLSSTSWHLSRCCTCPAATGSGTCTPAATGTRAHPPSRGSSCAGRWVGTRAQGGAVLEEGQ